MIVRKEVVLLLVSLAGGVGLAEVTARLIGAGRSEVSLSEAGAAVDQAPDASHARRFAAAVPLAPGVSLDWFTETLPPLPNRTGATALALTRFRGYERRGLFAPQSEYIWNRLYVEAERCKPNGRLHGFPPAVEAFEPPSGEPFPRYRFPASVTTVAGLVTNQFGFRGHPLTLAKPPRTIRVAFVGASTTIDFHYFAYSYPEFVEYWLNRVAGANGWNVRFEILNAGREGVGSQDIAAIVQYEVLPLDPDLIVYYEGANQFSFADKLLSPPIASRSQLDPKDEVVRPRVSPWLLRHFALARLLDRALNGFHTAGEPRKPSYRLVWPAGVDERKPDPNHPDLPLQLTHIVRDLETIRTGAEATGAQLAVGAFEWLVSDGMALSATRHAGIYRQLNTFLWPLRYGDARRLADFQNRVYRNYAAAHGLLFLDVAGGMPQEPDLFLDAIHTTEVGSRVKAWVVLQQLVPWLRQRIESGQLPRPSGARPLPPPPSMAHSPVSTECPAAVAGSATIAGAVALAELAPEHGVPAIQPGPPVHIVTGPARYSFAARAPLYLSSGSGGPFTIVVKARTLRGQVGFSALDSQTKDVQSEIPAPPTDRPVEIRIPVLHAERAAAFLVRNLAEGGVPSEVLLEDVRVVRAATH